MLDVWAQNDLPVLAELVRRLEVDRGSPRRYSARCWRLLRHAGCKRRCVDLRRRPATSSASLQKYRNRLSSRASRELAVRAVQAWPSPKGTSNDCSSL